MALGPAVSKLVLGPTFRVGLDEPASVAGDRLAACAQTTSRFRVERVGHHFQVSVPKARRHRWSPWLTIELRDESTDPAWCDVFGRFNPSPGIWTGYMLASLSLFTIAAIAVTWAGAELLMNKPPMALWAIPICVVILIGMWLISAAGQRLAHDEIAEMQELVKAALAQSPADTTDDTAAVGSA